MKEQPAFLPMTMEEAERLGIDRFDIILISGDAYVDHPSFGTALLGRVLWDVGYSVGVIAQPDWRSNDDLRRLGEPRLFFSVSSGNVDSMVNAFTPNLKRRSSDVYSPGGKLLRPDRATLVYTDRIHALYPKTPVVIGGIEASLRRFAHYDYWSDSVRQAILADAPADLLVFGMGERQVVAIADRLAAGEPVGALTDIPGTAYRMDLKTWRSMDQAGYVVLPGYAEVKEDRYAYARAFALHYNEQDPIRGRPVAQPHQKTVVIQNPPAMPLSGEELDRIYELPYARRAHPSYTEPIPALEPVRFSVVSHRGCFGSCSFCALTHHQGRIIQSRSIDSIVREVERMARMPEFTGVVQDVGGPTANMYGIHCGRWETTGTCPDRRCIDCPALDRSHEEQLRLLRRLAEIPGVKRVFIASGIRYDLIPPDEEYLAEVCEHHVSGHLKVAPEHVAKRVTAAMGKPPREAFDAFRERFEALQAGKKKRQYLVPYLMSGHPGCRMENMVELAEYVRDTGLYTEQVQDFTPTPMSISTTIYHTGLDPFTLKEVYVPKGREKRVQRALMHYRDPANHALVCEGLRAAGREDLIGSAWNCLVPARGKGGRPTRAGPNPRQTRRPPR
ncbi:MAG: YgiQ family radical SAM protein [Methanoculleus sp.]|uniref:YgiQ family radical SAM protein n=1 Tax=Methanoculleus sp. TaxID=90427 RepID=UPI0025F77C58|nr:YgiQ family radical SAM protein [Methanoculleus sp.]MCK9317622.1 YgiQ family radical SAM protein [Methanoculleus sp.]MDD2254977.1 YgiQ family radical SAM protein [Methanoculleus sp.]MDD4470416.1 YgiQ family radical SAM protein [Methanoculleus sp.]